MTTSDDLTTMPRRKFDDIVGAYIRADGDTSKNPAFVLLEEPPVLQRTFSTLNGMMNSVQFQYRSLQSELEFNLATHVLNGSSDEEAAETRLAHHSQAKKTLRFAKGLCKAYHHVAWLHAERYEDSVPYSMSAAMDKLEALHQAVTEHRRLAFLDPDGTLDREELLWEAIDKHGVLL